MNFSDFAARIFDAPPLPREEFVLQQGFIRDLEMCCNVLPDPRMWPQ
jgi:hypothetical protein